MRARGRGHAPAGCCVRERRVTIAMKTYLLGLAVLAAACQAPREPQASTQSTFTPDSVRAAELARFRTGLPQVHDLQDAAPTQAELGRQVVQAVAGRDTTLLRRLAMSRGEFAWIYYPTNPQAKPPYDLDPATLWLTLSAQSERGLARALERIGDHPVSFLGSSCDSVPSREGENTVYGPCTVRFVVAPHDTSEGRLYGLVIERHGRWKLVNYANHLD